jgi:hypothetical protein
LISGGLEGVLEKSRNGKENPRTRKKEGKGKAGKSSFGLSRLLRVNGIPVAICHRQINRRRKTVFPSPKKANHSKGWDAKSPA